MPASFRPSPFVVLLLLAFLVVCFAHNRNVDSDPRGTLLVSESIVHRGTIRMDHYGTELLDRLGYVVQQKNGHAYHFFPIGTAVMATPFVALFNLAGLSMITAEPFAQETICAVVAVLMLIALFRLAQSFLPPRTALGAAAVMWFGSSLASTGGTALWSHDFAVLFATLAIYGCVRLNEGRYSSWPWIGVCLFLAYFCRPTLSLLAIFMLPWLWCVNRAAAVKTALTLASLLALFVAFSQHEFGQWLPDYYLPQRLSGGHFTEALIGNLISPARGLLVFSPFIAAAALCWPMRTREWPLHPTWLLVGAAWPLAHLLTISNFPHWWAGFSFGPRLMMDALPGLFLLMLRVWPTEFDWEHYPVRISILVCACAFAVFVHTGQGLFNQWTARWNGEPGIDKYPELLFDWRYPQFLARESGHEDRLRRMASSGSGGRE